LYIGDVANLQFLREKVRIIR